MNNQTEPETLVFNSNFMDTNDYHIVMMETNDDGQRAVYDRNSCPEEVGFQPLTDAEVNSLVRHVCTVWGIMVPDHDDNDGLLYVDVADTQIDDEY